METEYNILYLCLQKSFKYIVIYIYNICLNVIESTVVCCMYCGYWCVICFFSLKEVDWEVELAFVIGRRGKHIKVSSVASPLTPTWSSCEGECCSFSIFIVQEEDALSYVAGFTVANDVSARDWQMKRNGKQWLLGKTFDSFCPLGPALVTTDAIKGGNKPIFKNRPRTTQWCSMSCISFKLSEYNPSRFRWALNWIFSV